MKTRTVSMKKISLERTLRTDFIYHNHFYDFDKDAIYYPFDELFEIVADKYDPQLLDGNFKYCQIGDVAKDGEIHPVQLNFNERNLLDESYYKKIEKGDIISVDKNDIILSFLLPQDVSIIGKMARITSDISDVYFTNAFIHIRPKRIPEILFYALRSIFYKDIIAVSRIRKGYTGYSTLDEADLRLLQFSKKSIDTLFCNYQKLNEEILRREEIIKVLNSQAESTQTIIDRVFRQEFNLNYDKFERLKSIKQYSCCIKSFSNNPDLRFSAKFHREAGGFVMHQLTTITDKKIKHFLSEPIVLGASISPSDFSESGSAYYISMASIKSLEIELDEGQLVSSSYYDNNTDKSLRQGDIIMARSGVAIGKVAMVKELFDGIFSDFTMRIRIDESKCNPEFVYYYFRSSFFQYLIEVYKKGLQNQNIFPIVMREFPMPDISLKEQHRIVDEIHTEITKQNDIMTKIANLRREIDKIIQETIAEGEQSDE